MKTLILRFADYFVPTTYYERELRIRARMIILLIAFSAVMQAIRFVYGAVSGVLPFDQLAKIFVYFLIQSAFLFLIKCYKQVEWSAFAYHTLTFFVIATNTVTDSKSVVTSSFQLYPLTLVFGFIVLTDYRKRLGLLAVSIFFSTASILLIKNGVSVSYNFSTPNFMTVYNVTVVTRLMLLLLCMYWYVQIKDMGARDLDQDMERRIASAKLLELNSLSRSYFPELGAPLARFQQEINDLLERDALIPNLDMARLTRQVTQIKDLTASISWIYKAYRNEQMGKAPASYLHTQVKHLMERKLSGTNVRIHFKPLASSFEMNGPLPTVFLLQLKVLEHVLARASLPSDSPLEFSMGVESVDWKVYLRLEWIEAEADAAGTKTNVLTSQEESDNEVFSPEFVREETLKELMALSSAEMIEDYSGPRHRITIRGAWSTPPVFNEKQSAPREAFQRNY